jgi:hypothetical protein
LPEYRRCAENDKQQYKNHWQETTLRAHLGLFLQNDDNPSLRLVGLNLISWRYKDVNGTTVDEPGVLRPARWLQLDEGASHLAHFAIAMLRPALNE